MAGPIDVKRKGGKLIGYLAKNGMKTNQNLMNPDCAIFALD